MMTTMTKTKTWTVAIGSIRDEISSDLLLALGFHAPYTNDQTNTALWERSFGNNTPICMPLAEAFAVGMRGDAAALEAIRIQRQGTAEQSLETARQKVAEIELAAAKERRIAEGIAFARQRKQA